jgi:beta-lactamase class A
MMDYEKLGKAADRLLSGSMEFSGRKILAASCLLVLIGGLIGWQANSYRTRDARLIQTSAIRADGYQLIKPLLVCNPNSQKNSESLRSTRKRVESLIKEHKSKGDITAAAVYFRYLNSGEEFSINREEKFYPASLHKLGLMIKFYKYAQTEPDILTAKREYKRTVDTNLGTIIPPKQRPIAGEYYSAEELIEFMIRYSDNNSFYELHDILGKNRYEKIYRDLQVDFPEVQDEAEDFITTQQMSYFFRILYGATYLSPDFSEKALWLLTQTDYNRALTREIPAEVTVAHKFGVTTVKVSNGADYGELHDCGIVYQGDNPYLLCIMTKSESPDISRVEKTIARISEAIYQETH